MYRGVPSSICFKLYFRCLITGESNRAVSKRFKVGRATVADIVYEVTSAICHVLHDEYLPTPTRERWNSIMDNFYRKSGFPNCLGILEGVNMTIRHYKPTELKTNQCLYIFLITIIDDSGRLVTTNIQHALQDERSATRIFPLNEAMKQWNINIPPSQFLPDSEIEAPCVLLANEQFPPIAQILKPAVSPVQNVTKLFNSKIELAKEKPESIFKKMMSRWIVLKRPMTYNVKIARTMFQAVCILHNFILSSDGSEMLNAELEPSAKWQGVTFKVIDDQCSTECEESAMRVRKVFQNYLFPHEK